MLFANANTGTIRHEKMNGREFIVAPVVAVREGVLNGEFLPVDEIAKSVFAWDDRPVVLGHPQHDGQYISARGPQTISDMQIGRFYNVNLDGDKLKGEIWVDVALAQATDEGRELLQRFLAGEPVEVSTAYDRRPAPQSGAFKGTAYESIAHDLEPDHLAVLLHDIGACSWADGCGAPRVNSADDQNLIEPVPVANTHSRTKCMRCDAGPQVDVIWAEGRARAWFCESCFTKWVADNHEGDVVRKHKVDGEVPKKFGDSLSDLEENVEDGELSDTQLEEQDAEQLRLDGIEENQEANAMEEMVMKIMADGRLGLTQEDMVGMTEVALQKLLAHLEAMGPPPEEGEDEPPEAQDELQPEQTAAEEGTQVGNATAPCARLTEAVNEAGGVDQVLEILANVKQAEADAEKVRVEKRAEWTKDIQANAGEIDVAALDDEALEQMAAVFNASKPDFTGQGGAAHTAPKETQPMTW